MQFNEVEFKGAMPIDGYGPGFFRVGGKAYEGAVLVLPNSISAWGGFDDVGALLALKVDVLFVGTGAQTTYLPKPFLEALQNAGIGVEPMASPAACRTYNVLLAEERRIAAALLPV